MNAKHFGWAAAALLAGTLGMTECRAQRPRHGRQVGGADVAVYAGARFHSANRRISGYPFGNSDITGTVGVEFRDADAYWQLLLDGVDSFAGARHGDARVFTPQLNLIFKDRAFLGGVGVLRTYVDDGEERQGWTRFYYQYLLGLDLPIGSRFGLTAFAAYPIVRWRDLYQFRSSELEYTVGLSFRF